MLTATDGKLPHGKGITDAIAVAVLESCNIATLFVELHKHMIHTTVENNHIQSLIKHNVKILQDPTIPPGQTSKTE